MFTSIRQSLLPCCTRPLEYEKYKNLLWELSDTFSCCQLHTVGTTAGGHSIYAVSLGAEGDLRSVAYVGGIDGADWISTAILLRFITDYCLLHADGSKLYSVHLPYLYANRRICVCPRLNCDGAEAVRMGAENPACRNGLGTDIAEAFSYPDAAAVPAEKCPEASALRQYLQFQNPALLITLFGTCPGGEKGTGALVLPGYPAPRTGTVGRLLSRMLTCPLTEDKTGKNSGTSVSDWFAGELGHPAFSAMLGLEGTEDGFYRGYAAAREALFSLPLLV